MNDKPELLATAKIMPPWIAIGVEKVMGLSLNDWVLITALVYTLLQIVVLVRDKIINRQSLVDGYDGIDRRQRDDPVEIDRRQSGKADVRALVSVAVLVIGAGSGGFYFTKSQEGVGPVKTVGQKQVAVAYPDPAHGWKKPTICAGRTKGVFQGQTATLDECDAWLIEDLTYAGAAIKRCTPVKMTQWQYNYLASFVHNVGGGAYCDSQVARNINAGRCEMAAKEMHAMPQIDRSTGKPRIWRGKPIIYRQTGEVLLATGAPIMKWTTAAGIPLPGLIKRRNTEAAGFAADCDLWKSPT